MNFYESMLTIPPIPYDLCFIQGPNFMSSYHGHGSINLQFKSVSRHFYQELALVEIMKSCNPLFEALLSCELQRKVFLFSWLAGAGWREQCSRQTAVFGRKLGVHHPPSYHRLHQQHSKLSTVQYSTVQYSTVQYSTVQYSTDSCIW